MSELFRFIVVRPPSAVDQEDIELRASTTHPAGEIATDLVSELRQAREQGNRDGMRRSANAFLASARYVRSLSELQLPFADLDRLLPGSSNLEFEATMEAVAASIGGDLESVINAEEFREDWARAGDSVLALRLGRSSPGARPVAPRAVRLASLIDLLARRPGDLERPGVVRNILRANLLIPDRILPLPVVPPSDAADMPAGDNGDQADRARIERRIGRLSTAIDELAAAYELDRVESIRNRRENAPEAAPTEEAPVADSEFLSTLATSERSPFLSETASRSFRSTTVRLLNEVGVNPTEIRVPTVVATLERELAESAREISEVAPLTSMVMIGSSVVPVYEFVGAGLLGSVGGPSPCPPSDQGGQLPTVPLHTGPGSVEALGVGELLRVEDRLRTYEVGEIAHVENILEGESKERTHRRLRETEDTTTTERETISEEERNLNSTERFELQSETAEVVAENTAIQAGLTVSGSYGWVSFTASANFATETAREESQRSAISQSRDVTERAASRLQERTLERRVLALLM